MNSLLFLLSCACYVVYTVWKLQHDLHILQLNSYITRRYLRWIYKNFINTISPKDFLPGCAILFLLLKLNILGLMFWSLSYLFLFFTREKRQAKKPFQFTPRATRLFVTIIALLLVLSLSALYWMLSLKTILVSVIIFMMFLFLNVFSFSIIILSNFLLTPLEKGINHWYYTDARRRMQQMPHVTVIGITGSFGKTSTKSILHKILSEERNVLTTPQSYNTPMGVTKVIRTLLKPTHEIFIVEMGAKQRGDIEELCKLVSPRLGVLTAIGAQHLETFKSLENIKRTKYELIESLPNDGMAFFNMDDEHIRALSTLTQLKQIHYGLYSANLHYSARNIRITSTGSFFEVYKYDGLEISLYTKLLGQHNIYNILAAVAIACELGIDVRIIPSIVKNLEPIPHRLELKKTPQHVTIIDDAFNANPVGSHIALDVLKEMTGEKKILVTPGMIELGDKEYEYNRDFGIHATEVCDYIILVGSKRTLPIQDGLQSKHYPAEKYYLAKDLYDANDHLQKLIQPGAVVLYENDLPDNYNE